MSHFSVAVFTDGTKTAEELLKPYDKAIVVDRYIYKTKDQIIKEKRESLNYTKQNYEKWLSNKKEYEEKSNKYHIEYLKNEFMSDYNMTDDEIHKCQLQLEEEEDKDDNGNITAIHNPKGKWDWYVIGGRWSGMLEATKGENGQKSFFDLSPYSDGKYDIAKVKDITFDSDFLTYAVITPDGEWHERGTMLAFGMSIDEQEDWEEKYKERFIDTANPELTLTIVDCHV